MKLSILSAILVAAVMTGVAHAQSDSAPYDWTGFYAGLNAGGVWDSTCDSWTASGPTITPAIAGAFNSRSCPHNSSFIGGLQLGYNWQVQRMVYGVEADYDGWSTNNHNRSVNYSGVVPPGGTYLYGGDVSPNGFGTIRVRIGYALDRLLLYGTAGAIFVGGSHQSTLSSTPAAANFIGGKDFSSNGWVVGAGSEYAIAGPWSIKAEYLYAKIGNGNNTITNCSGTAAACLGFGGISIENTHNSFTANIFRVGFNYRFGARAAPAQAPAPAPAYVPPPPPHAAAPPPLPPAPPKPVALCPDTPPGVAVDRYGCPCDVTQEVHFATDSSKLTDQDMALLDKMISNMRRLNFIDGEVGGYTDSTGNPAYNKGLSERRAQSVADYLTSHGISGGRLTVKGYGESNAVDTNSTAEGRAHNRRVVLHRVDCGK